MIKLTDENLEQELGKQSFTGVIKFAAEWCVPCQQIKQIYSKIATENVDCKFAEADVDENPTLTETYNIMKIPTIVFVSNGVEVGRINGVFKESEFNEQLAKTNNI